MASKLIKFADVLDDVKMVKYSGEGGDFLRLAKNTDEYAAALKKSNQIFEAAGFPSSFLDDTVDFVKKGDDDIIRTADGVEIKLKELDDLMIGNPAKLLPPNSLDAYVKLGKADELSDSVRDTLKANDVKNLDAMKVTDEWKHADDLEKNLQGSKKLDEATPIKRDATPEDTLNEVKKNKGITKRLDDIEGQIRSGKKSKLGKFIKVGAITAAGVGAAWMVNAIKKHQANMNGCWVINQDDPRECYKIRRDGDSCDKDYGCKYIDPYDARTRNLVDDKGRIKNEGDARYNLLWSNCKVGTVRSAGELCCRRSDENASCGYQAGGTTCEYDSDNEVDTPGYGDEVSCSIPKEGGGQCATNWKSLVDGYKQACVYENTSGYEIAENGDMTDKSGTVECDEDRCSFSSIRLLQVATDPRRFAIECKDVGFWEAAADFTGIDELTEGVEDIFDIIRNYGKIFIYVVAGLMAFSIVWWVVQTFVLPFLGVSDIFGSTQTVKVEVEAVPAVVAPVKKKARSGSKSK